MVRRVRVDQSGASNILKVVRWRRFGKDRLYVNGAVGIRIGWVDLMTDEVTVDVPEMEVPRRAAVSAWKQVEAAATGEPRTSGSDPPWSPAKQGLESPGTADNTQSTVSVADNDAGMASNQPGQSLKLHAVAEQEAAPMRSWLARLLRLHTQERAYRMGERGEALLLRS